MSNLVHRAARLAAKAHKGQVRKFGKGPYIYHPMRVAGLVTLLEDSDDHMVAAAWLHDVLEDTDIPFEQLEQDFGVVALMVRALTDAQSKDLLRSERKAAQWAKMATAPHAVKVIKCCDRLDNLLDMPWDDFRQHYARESILLCEAMAKGHAVLLTHPAYIALVETAERMAAE